VDCLSEVEAVARHDAVTTADGSTLASSLQNNGEQCVTAIWNVLGSNDMIATCGMSGSATMDLSKLMNDKQSPKYDTGAQGLRKTVTQPSFGNLSPLDCNPLVSREKEPLMQQVCETRCAMILRRQKMEDRRLCHTTSDVIGTTYVRHSFSAMAFVHAAIWDSAQTRSQGLRGLKKTVTICPSLPFPYAPFGLVPCPACPQQMFAQKRECQDHHAKACHCKQHLYNAAGDYIPNNLDDNLKDNNNLDIYLPGTIFHVPDSATSHLLLARIKQAQEPLLPCKLTALVSHPLLLHLLLKCVTAQ
jgi:hypothetical protein